MKHEPIDCEVAKPVAPPAAKGVRVGKFLVVLVIVGIAVAGSGIASRRQDDETLTKWAREQATPTVAVTTVRPDTTIKQVALPGDVEAFYSASIHAQVSGYVKEWRTDIGAKVRKGDVLAVIDTPEIDDRISQAQGELEKANANLALAKVTADRWRALRSSSAVSQQAIDEKVGDERAKQADVSAAEAALDRLRALKNFAQIVAPFDGVVTARNIDIGSLVSSNPAPGSTPLFVVADIRQMRIYVRAPEVYAAALKNGMTAKLHLPEYPGRPFTARIETTSHAIDVKSRALLVELIADNNDEGLRPGSFAQVDFEIPPAPNATRLSASALLFRDQATMVAAVDAADRIKLYRVRIVRDYGSEVEIEGELPAGAKIVVSPPESIADGDDVRLAAVDANHDSASAINRAQAASDQAK
jgi:RND family efflux transporter MFP subunit